MDINVSEWLNLLVRWFHIIAGITWIGQTYLFNWMERRLTPATGPGRDNVMGQLWMVHGGGFYLVEKQREPELMPRLLYWFKWESALTWISGFLLLVIVYWTGGVLVDLQSGISEAGGIAISVSVLVAGWVGYNMVWRSPLGRNEIVGAAVSWLLVVGLVQLLNGRLSSRAAYLHVGAMFGTIMAANVWLRILPAQRQMLAATKAGDAVDMTLAARARQCSKHNTYLSVPLIAIMISNHFPTATYGSHDSALVLGGLTLVGWGAAKVMRDVL